MSRRLRLLLLGWVLMVPFWCASTPAVAALSAVPDVLDLSRGKEAKVQLLGVRGRLRLSSSNRSVVEAEISDGRLKVKAKAAGSAVLRITDGRSSISIPVTVASRERDRHDGGGAGGSGGGSGGGTSPGASYTLLGWNDLGMHCMDADYSVFSILPPYNNLHAQLVNDATSQIVTQGVTISFEAMADPDGSINSSSTGKTNFWDYAQDFFGAPLPLGLGLAGFATANPVPQAMKLDAASRQFIAEGIPITPYDDAMAKNFYPLVKVVARNASNQVLAEARVVLPVSDEMTCVGCHGSGSGDAAKPKAGWVNEANRERDYRRNILRLHDEQQGTLQRYRDALVANGYSAAGLLATADGGKSILCASCHASNALPGTGVKGITPLTESIHKQHSTVKDAVSGLALDDINNRGACYQCHPGSETRCLRGVMGNALLADGSLAMQCQSCHGKMTDVGRTGRVGWLEQPDCQACHHDGKRETAAVRADGSLKVWADARYATNADVPAAGFNLFRFSKGHGGLQCEACHGSTHAEFPSSHRNDNLLSLDVQGREGSIGECASCHQSVPVTADGGPHGMHTMGARWVGSHEDFAERNIQACAYCHGADFRGSALSKVKVAQTFSADGRRVSYAAGQAVGCYDCHNGPRGD